MELLPVQTRYTTELLLQQLDEVQKKIEMIEGRMREAFEQTEDMKLLMSMPGVGFILAVVISLEVGDVGRFADEEKLASYSGVTPRVHSSGDKTRYGRLRPDTNHYLKWAFSEAANSVAVNRRYYPQRFVVGLYNRIRARKGHSVAIGAVAKHLAESAYWVLSKKQVYKERGIAGNLPTRA